ncbi:hypothetical protein [Pelomonas caseinilytica]|uniref:hypothetical protein n=1 Tax=Pelomonas caseinilytica TaxID=2906763 RepID=UPI003B01A34A
MGALYGCKSRRKLITANEAKRNSRRWWRNSTAGLNGVLTIAWFDRLGLPPLS